MKALISSVIVVLLGVVALFVLAAPSTMSAGALASAPGTDLSPGGAATPVPTCAPSWAIVASPNPSTSTQQYSYPANQLAGVSALASDDVWAVGYYVDPTALKPNSPSKHVAKHSPNDKVQSPSGSSAVIRTLVEHWDGTAWTVVPSPNNGPDDNALTAVVAIAPDDIWAAGYYINNFGVSQTLVEHWDGAAWSIVDSPNVGPLLDNKLTAIDARSSDDIWAVGYYYNDVAVAETLIEHWDGAAWSIVDSPNVGDMDNTLYGVTVVSDTDAWAVGSYAIFTGTQLVYKSLAMRWNGVSWSVVATPGIGSFTNILYGVDAVAADDVWAVGLYIVYGRGSRALIEHWDGTSWNPVPSPLLDSTSNSLYAVEAIATDDVWAVGQAGGYNSPPEPLTEHWDGEAWTEVRSPGLHLSGYTALLSVSAVASEDIWAVGFAEGYSDGGYNYERRTLVEHYSTDCVSCPTSFQDVPPGSPFYPYVQCMACQGIVSGYPCEVDPCFPGPVPTGGSGTPFPTAQPSPTTVPNSAGFFRPGSPVTRGQLAKIIANSASYTDEPGGQIFEDVPYYTTFYYWVNQLAHREIITGYPCGTVPEEPCRTGNLPYFRPNANATRGQIAKIVSNAKEFSDTVPPVQQTFADVPPSSPFWLYIERLRINGSIIGGYPCGSAGEPCPGIYFRPQNNASRGQVSKIVSKAFLPNCYLP